MRCKICGYSARTISAMAKHYRKEHSDRMRKRRKKVSATDVFMGRPQKEFVEKMVEEYLKRKLGVRR